MEDHFGIIPITATDNKGEIQLTDAIDVQAKQGRVLACRFQGRRFDCGSVDAFIEATNYNYQHIYGG